MYPAPPSLRRGDNLQLTCALLKPQMCPAPPSETICSKISHSVCHLQALKKLTAKALCKRHVCSHHLCQMYVPHVCSHHLCQMYVSHVCSHDLCQIMYPMFAHIIYVRCMYPTVSRTAVVWAISSALNFGQNVKLRCKRLFSHIFFFSLNFPPPLRPTLSFVSKWLVEFDVDESLLE